MPRTAVITFARMNPIHIGHELLVNNIKQTAASMGATPIVYLSHTSGNKKNPLDYLVKFNLAQLAFGKVMKLSPAKNPIDVLKSLDGQYDNIIFYGDGPRSRELLPILNRYNNLEYTFKSIDTMSAGERSDDSDDIEGVSATKMRGYAINNRVSKFESCLPDNLKPITENIMQLVRKGLNYAN